MSAAHLWSHVRPLLPPLEGGLEDLLLPLYQGIILIALRVAANNIFVPLAHRYLKPRPSTPGAKDASVRAYEVVDNAFLVLIIAPLSTWGWWVMLNHNGPCVPTSPKGCLVGLPDHPMSLEFRWWWLSVAGLYTAEMIGTLLGGVGFKLNVEMFAHHVVTMALMYYGYYGGLHRYGQMATTVLDTSNTFLHAAKAVHATGLPSTTPLSDFLFKLFALSFFIVRVVMLPVCMLLPGIIYGGALPPVTYCITNGLMCIIYGLQLMWFRKIVRIATGADHKPAAAAAAASKQD